MNKRTNEQIYASEHISTKHTSILCLNVDGGIFVNIQLERMIQTLTRSTIRATKHHTEQWKINAPKLSNWFVYFCYLFIYIFS